MGGAGIAESVIAMSEIAKEIQEGDGLLHSLIYDSYEGGGVQSVDRSLAILEEILDTIAHGDGIIHSLIYESPEDQQLVIQAFEAGANLNVVLEKVNRGEGTLGLLLNDPTLYEDLKLLVGGAQRSRVVRSLIRLSSEEEE
jgi:phospholipid/cholesterol/gamma-HCH transport system substrate-binding protein